MPTPPPTSTVPRMLRVPASALLLLSGLWSVLVLVHGFGFIEDDAYIHLEFARSLARGLGFSFNGHVVYGDTAPLWVFLLVAVHAVVAHGVQTAAGWIVSAKVLGVLGMGFAASGVYACARRVTGHRTFAAWMVLVFVLNPYVFYWSFSGMETVAAAGLALWLATLVSDRELSWTRFLLAALLAGCGPLLRPEMLFLAAIIAAVLLLRWWQNPIPTVRKLPALLASAALLAAPALGWAIYALHTFGRVVPNTNAAKRAAPGQSVVVRLASLYGFAYPALLVGLALLAVAVLLYLARPSKAPVPWRSVPVALWIFAAWTAIATVFYIVNHTLVQSRYLLPSASGLLLCVCASLWLAWPRRVVPVIAFAGVAGLLGSVVYAWPNVGNKVQNDRDVASLSAYLQSNLPADAPVALYAIGEVAFRSEHPVIDTGGITRTSAIPYLYDAPGMARWVHTQGGMYWIAGAPPEPGATLVYSIEKPETGWPLNPRAYGRHDDRYNLWKLQPEP